MIMISDDHHKMWVKLILASTQEPPCSVWSGTQFMSWWS